MWILLRYSLSVKCILKYHIFVCQLWIMRYNTFAPNFAKCYSTTSTFRNTVIWRWPDRHIDMYDVTILFPVCVMVLCLLEEDRMLFDFYWSEMYFLTWSACSFGLVGKSMFLTSSIFFTIIFPLFCISEKQENVTIKKYIKLMCCR